MEMVQTLHLFFNVGFIGSFPPRHGGYLPSNVGSWKRVKLCTSCEWEARSNELKKAKSTRKAPDVLPEQTYHRGHRQMKNLPHDVEK